MKKLIAIFGAVCSVAGIVIIVKKLAHRRHC